MLSEKCTRVPILRILSLIIQIAKHAGLKVVGSTGSDEKVAFLKNELGADVAFNYKKDDTRQVLAQHPFDIFFDNVNGETLDIALTTGKHGARFLVSRRHSSSVESKD